MAHKVNTVLTIEEEKVKVDELVTEFQVLYDMSPESSIPA